MKGFAPKCTVVKVDMLQDRKIVCLEAYVWAPFSPEMLLAAAVKGLTLKFDPELH